MTDKARLHLYDTTLRDGAQTSGIDFSVEEKIVVAGLIEDLGFSYIEGGYPGANPTDDAFFTEKRTTKARFVAFGMTKRPGVSLSNDPGVAALLARHAQRRREDRERTLAFSDGLARMTANPSPLLRPLRSLGLLGADRGGWLQAWLVGGAMGFRGDVPELCR